MIVDTRPSARRERTPFAPARAPRIVLAVLAVLVAPMLVAACGMFGSGVPALPAGLQQCIGMEQDQCAELASSGTKAGARQVAWRVRCTTSACDRSAGSAEITVTWSDGTTDISNSTWVGESNGGPQPNPKAS